MMKHLILAWCVVFAFGSLSAQKAVWQPSPGHTQVPIWPGAPPNPEPVTGPESMSTITKDLVAGRPWIAVRNVTRPTMTVYSCVRAAADEAPDYAMASISGHVAAYDRHDFAVGGRSDRRPIGIRV